MATADQDLLRTLASWETRGLPVSTLYLDVDGRRYPRRRDFLVRMDDLLGQPGAAPDRKKKEAFASFCRDRQRMQEFVRDDLDRTGTTRGIALFSCAGANLWEAVSLPRPVRDRFVVGSRPHLVPLESVLEEAEVFCTAIVDRAKARLVFSRLGVAEEVSGILDDVPGQHDQGGWAQARLQRHIEDHVQRHLKHVADALLRLHQSRGFDHLVLAGPEEVVAALERELHDYVRRTIVDRISLPMTASVGDVLARTTEMERELERRREREAVDRLRAEMARGSGLAVRGMGETLAALEAGRVDTLIVDARLQAQGVRCPACGHLDLQGERCSACGATVDQAPDLVEEAVEAALRQRCRVETVADGASLEPLEGIGALLRF